MSATTFAVLQCNATPVFADVDAETFQISAESIKQRITPKTKAIITVALYGLSPDMDPIMALADRSVCGAEALVRWQHPQRGLLTPGDFISTVEQTDLVGPLSRYVLERSVTACAGSRCRATGRQPR